MRRSLLVLLVLTVLPSSAAAAPVLVLGRDGRVSSRNDRFVTGPALTPRPAIPVRSPLEARPARGRPRATSSGGGAAVSQGSQPPARPRRGHRRRRRRRPPITVAAVLLALYRAAAITPVAYQQDNASWGAALAAEKHLTGTRRDELDAVTENVHQIAVAHQLTPSRLPALFATVDRNRQWWTTGPLLSGGQRVEFTDSQLVWQYYPGQGLQLQVLGSFGKADGLYTAGAADYPQMEQLLSELIPLAAYRGASLVWEYYFNFDGGSPPWTSAMSQATGLEALTRAYEATGNQYYLQIAGQALPIFTIPPPTGVDVPTPLGIRFLQYTFAPTTAIINAFLQTLIGLHDYAAVSGNQLAAQLFAAGNAEALAELPTYDTGAWSLYQPGVEDSLSYHQLVTGFLAQLCTLTAEPPYCTTAARFSAYLTTPPTLAQLTFSGRSRRPLRLRFALSKYSHVGLVVTQGVRTVFSTSAYFPHGVDSFSIPPLKHPGVYSIALAATDLAGNFSRITGTLGIASG